MNFVEAMQAAQSGFDLWAAKPHNAKWFKRIDGTPIPSDLLVNIAEAFCRATSAPVAVVPVGVKDDIQFELNSALEFADYPRAERMQRIMDHFNASQRALIPAAKPAGVDEVTEDEIRSRAKEIIRRNGWLEQKAPPQLISTLELMVALGLDVLKSRPASCGYPDCGCDFDAVCNAALTGTATPKPEGVQVAQIIAKWTEMRKLGDPNDYALAAAALSTAPAGDGVPGMVLVPKGWKPTHQHVKRGSEYRLDGYGEIQTDTPLTDYAKVAIYSAADGCVWVRPVTEFEDGRFVALSASTAGGGK